MDSENLKAKGSSLSMKKLRLAVLNTQPPLFLGGVERRILETSKDSKAKLASRCTAALKRVFANPPISTG